MRFSSTSKLFYWAGTILILIVIIVFIRWDAITSVDIASFDVGLLCVFIILILLPFFSEISIFGISVKEKIEEGNKEIKQFIEKEILSVKMELNNTISVGNQANPQFHLYVTPPDNMLAQRTEMVKSSAQAFLVGVDPQDDSLRTDSDENDKFIIVVNSRKLIEIELRRIWNEIFPKPPRTNLGAQALIGNLHRYGNLPEDLAMSASDIIHFSDVALNGGEITGAQAEYIEEVTPYVISALKKFKAD